MNELIRDNISPYFDKLFKKIDILEDRIITIDNRIDKIEKKIENIENIISEKQTAHHPPECNNTYNGCNDPIHARFNSNRQNKNENQ